MDASEIARMISELSESLKELKRDMNSRFDQMDFSMHEIKIELDAKIDSKIDKVRFEIVDLSSNMENRFTLLTEQVDSKLLEINDKIDSNKTSTDVSIANISQEVYEINEKFNQFLLLDFDQRVDDKIRPTINSMRESQVNVLQAMEDVAATVDLKKFTITSRPLKLTSKKSNSSTIKRSLSYPRPRRKSLTSIRV
jgi:hypothetical protein